MVKLTVNGVALEVPENTTLLEAAKLAGTPVPSLCYWKGLNEIGACRVCVVEVEGIDKLVTACNNPVQEGMVVHTNSPRVRAARRTNLRLILSQHDCQCAFCVRSGNCELQKMAMEANLLYIPYPIDIRKSQWDRSAPLIRQESKCIKCMRCIQVCDKIQSLNIWDVAGTGSRVSVNVSHNRTIREADCAFCGQCVTHCPTAALRERDDTEPVLDALADPEITTVVQVAPAVRVAWAEQFGLTPGPETTGRMVTALKRLGFDYVFDTNFGADLTIMEEGSEFVERFTHREDYAWPMFTSCCPGWVRFVKSNYPEFTDNLSTAKSPQQMFGAVAKSYFAEKIGVDPHKIKVISIMPCLAKKEEAALEPLRDACGDPDVDIVLTTREFVRMVRSGKSAGERLRQPPGHQHRGGGGLRRHRRRHGRGTAQRLLPDHRTEPQRRHLPGGPGHGQRNLEGGRLQHPRSRRGPSGGGQQPGPDPEAAGGPPPGGRPLRLCGGYGLPRRLRRRRRAAHRGRRGDGRVPGRRPVGAGQGGAGPLQPRKRGRPDSVPGLPGAALRPAEPPPAPHRPPRLADAAGSAEGKVKSHREPANVLPPRVRPEGKGMEAVFPGPERPENAHAFSAWAFSTVKKDGLRPGKGETMEKRIALVAIVVEAPDSVERLNAILHDYREHIIGRMGLPCRQEGLSLISVAVCAPGDVISALSGKLGMLPGVSAKTAYAKTVTE